MIDDQLLFKYFPRGRRHSSYFMIPCPYHANGEEKHPSMSILLSEKNGVEAGFCHCFACGKKTNITQMFKDLNLELPADTAISTATKEQAVTLTTSQKIMKYQLPFRFSKYLESRGIGKETQEKFRIYEKDKIVHMPVFSRDGRYLYDNARSTEGKHFYVEVGAIKTLWGIEEIDMTRPVFVCESQIDSLSLWEINCQSVATLGADNVNSLTALKRCTSIIVLAFDPDDAGIRARKRASILLGKFRCHYIDLPPGVDINQALVDIKDKTTFKNFLQKCTKKCT